MSLHDNHRKALLEESAISEETVKQRGYWTAESKTDLKNLGFKKAQRNVPALVMPVYSPTGEVSMYLSRPDDPRIKDDGKAVKYEIASGARMALDVPPSVNGALGDPSVPLFVTEGIKKGDALASRGLVAAALVGVWNWRGKNAQGGKTALAEWEWVALNDRKAYIVFDSDVMEKPEVYKALVRLKGLLAHRGANVKLIYLPALPDGSKQGVDDFLGGGGKVEDLYELASSELLAPPDEESLGLTADLADTITEEESFARDAGDKLYYFSEGVYKPGGERRVRTLVKHLMLEWGVTEKWSSHRTNEVVAYLLADCPVLWERPPLDRINVANGILDKDTRELEDHDPDFLSTVQIPVAHEPEAGCPAWEKQVADTFPEDAQSLAWEIAADLIQPDRSHQKAILFVGEGGNGKSVFLENIAAFVGKRNRSSRSLQRLEADRFTVSSLVGKLANICPDLPSKHLTGTSMFKAITGGDEVTGEYKYKDQFDFTPFCRLLFSANRPPASDDDTHAFFRRWVVVPFERTFDPDKAVPREQLDAALTDPGELSGLLNKALEALPGLRRDGFSEPESVQRAHEEFRETTDPLSVWLARYAVEGTDLYVAKDELIRAYNDHCKKEGRAAVSNTAFGKALKRLRPGVGEAQRTVNGKPKTHVYTGIGLRSDNPDGLDGDSHNADERHAVHGVHAVSPIVSRRSSNEEASPDNNGSNSVNRVNRVSTDDSNGSGRRLTEEEVAQVQKLIRQGMSPEQARGEVIGGFPELFEDE